MYRAPQISRIYWTCSKHCGGKEVDAHARPAVSLESLSAILVNLSQSHVYSICSPDSNSHHTQTCVYGRLWSLYLEVAIPVARKDLDLRFSSTFFCDGRSVSYSRCRHRISMVLRARISLHSRIDLPWTASKAVYKDKICNRFIQRLVDCCQAKRALISRGCPRCPLVHRRITIHTDPTNKDQILSVVINVMVYIAVIDVQCGWQIREMRSVIAQGWDGLGRWLGGNKQLCASIERWIVLILFREHEQAGSYCHESKVCVLFARSVHITESQTYFKASILRDFADRRSSQVRLQAFNSHQYRIIGHGTVSPADTVRTSGAI